MVQRFECMVPAFFRILPGNPNQNKRIRKKTLIVGLGPNDCEMLNTVLVASFDIVPSNYSSRMHLILHFAIVPSQSEFLARGTAPDECNSIDMPYKRLSASRRSDLGLGSRLA
jgi:hypothetical protein